MYRLGHFVQETPGSNTTWPELGRTQSRESCVTKPITGLLGHSGDAVLETALEPLTLQPDEEVDVQGNHLLDPDSASVVICKKE